MSNPIRFFRRRRRTIFCRSPQESLGLTDLDLSFDEVVSSMHEDELAGLDLDDLRDFMEGTEETPMADPVFKERLRKELWWMMVSRLVPGGGTPPSS